MPKPNPPSAPHAHHDSLPTDLLAPLNPSNSISTLTPNLFPSSPNPSQGVEFWAVNTDAQALANHAALNKVQIGTELTRGLGCGGNPSLGKQAALESEAAIKKMVEVGRPAPFPLSLPPQPRVSFLCVCARVWRGSEAALDSKVAIKKIRLQQLIGI